MYGSDQPFSFKTINDEQWLDNKQAVIDGLKRNTKYAIVIQAFNSVGPGPLTLETVAETLKIDPPPAPTLSLGQVTFTSIELHWSFDAAKDADERDISVHDTSSVSSYVVYVKKDQFGWEEKQLSRELSAFTFTDLNCGSKYQFYIIAVNSAGKGKPSQAIVARTKGSSEQILNL